MIPNKLKGYDYRENLIIDKDNPILIQKAWRDRFSNESHWNAGYGGQAYLSRQNSEDALTWNVFRGLQLAGKEGLNVISTIFRTSMVDKILFWGCDVEHRGEEQQLLNILIRIIDGKHRGTMTEPDLVLSTQKKCIFVECKLNQSNKDSPWKARGEGAQKRMETYKQEFPELNDINDWKNVYQLIRQYVYAKSLSHILGKEPLVIPLINEKHQSILSSYYSQLQKSKLNHENIFRDFINWQGIEKTISKSKLPDKETISVKINEALRNAK